MPSGHPKDPVAYRQRMLEARERRAFKKAENLTEAKRLVEQGYSIAAIASQMSMPVSSVRALLAPPVPVRKHTAKKKATAAEMKVQRLSDEALAALREKLTGVNPNGPLVPPGGPFPRKRTVKVTQKGTGRTAKVPVAEFFQIEQSEVYKALDAKYDAAEIRAWQQQERAEIAERRLAILFDLVGRAGL